MKHGGRFSRCFNTVIHCGSVLLFSLPSFHSDFIHFFPFHVNAFIIPKEMETDEELIMKGRMESEEKQVNVDV